MKEHGLFYDLVKFHTCMIGLEIVGVSVQPNNAPKNRNLKKKHKNPRRRAENNTLKIKSHFVSIS